MNITYYKKGNGRYPVKDFIDKQGVKEKAILLGHLKSVQILGFESPKVNFRQIYGKLWEIKIRSVNGQYRIFYVTLTKNQLVLLHGYQKKTNKAPTKEIKIAETRMKEVYANESIYT